MGILVPNLTEKTLGRNPDLANIPMLEVSFIKDYSIIINHHRDGKNVNTLFEAKGKDKGLYQDHNINEQVVKHIALKEVARIGTFSTHHFGNIPRINHSWIRYSSFNEHAYIENMNKFNSIESADINSISIITSNSIQLIKDDIYDSIENIELRFLYYDYEKGDFVPIGTKILKGVFSSGVTRSFHAHLKNVPLSLIQDSYFEHGEFIITEITDYFIPSINTTYRTLQSSVDKKTISVLYDTPLESSTYYVSADKHNTFAEILNTAFEEQYELVDNNLTKIHQFSNNLGSYTTLHEVAERSKDGKWYVLTNNMEEHYTKHRYDNNDYISLIYATGSTLAHQRKNTLQINEIINTEKEHKKTLSIGKIHPNSEIHIRISPHKIWGEMINKIVNRVYPR